MIPGMILIDRIAQRIGLDKRSRFFQLVVVGTAEQNADIQVDVDQIGGDQLAIDDHTRE